MLRLIREISQFKGVSVVVSSHLLPDVEETCQHVVVMRDGQVTASGSVETLRQTAGVQLDVELREPVEAFYTAIESRGGHIVNRLGSRCRLSLPEATPDPVREVLAAAVATGAQVRGVRPATRSLEDIFMEAVS